MNIEESVKQIKSIIKVRKEQKEIIELSNGYCSNCNEDIEALETLLIELETKEKIIDLMTQQISFYDSHYGINNYLSEREIKEKFRKKVQ